jgi:hypothetical protein
MGAGAMTAAEVDAKIEDAVRQLEERIMLLLTAGLSGTGDALSEVKDLLKDLEQRRVMYLPKDFVRESTHTVKKGKLVRT